MFLWAKINKATVLFGIKIKRLNYHIIVEIAINMQRKLLNTMQGKRYWRLSGATQWPLAMKHLRLSFTAVLFDFNDSVAMRDMTAVLNELNLKTTRKLWHRFFGMCLIRMRVWKCNWIANPTCFAVLLSIYCSVNTNSPTLVFLQHV